MEKRKVYLLCNAHLDPVWLWDRDEGIAEVLSTFRVAADFAEEDGHFVFNHNEAVLYEWVEEYEPELFAKIQRLVEQGKWHIMGGWYLQPDCNMPSGESFVRQIREGRKYFNEKFHKEPTTAINFDPFGHTIGLVQILAKAGYDSYLFMRPLEEWLTLPAEDFIWKGLDGSEVLGHRLADGYKTLKGEAAAKLDRMLKNFPDKDPMIVLWGIGNHGGGPSREDLDDLNKKIEEYKNDMEIIHGTPEEYFAEIAKKRDVLPVFDESLQLWSPGCYTSQVRIKQLHRRLENDLYMTEKIATAAALQQGMEYPEKDFRESERDLLFAQFHDILPGSSIQDVEETGMRILNHGIEILSRIRIKAFLKLCAGQRKGSGTCIPVFVYNPHPYVVEQPVYCEFQLEDQNWEDNYTIPVVEKDGEKVPCQLVQEKSSLTLDWRKQVVFLAKLEPFQMSRFDCNMIKVDAKAVPSQEKVDGNYVAGNEKLETIVNAESGMLQKYAVEGHTYTAPEKEITLSVYEDDEDPWGMLHRDFQNRIGEFKPMTAQESAVYCGIDAEEIEPCHVIEDGEVEKVTETMLKYGDSHAVVTCHTPKKGNVVHVQVRVIWNEGKKMLKLRIPTSVVGGKFLGQTAFGVDTLKADGTECVAGKWVGLFDKESNRAMAVINGGSYGCSCVDDTIELTLLRGACYSAHPINSRKILPQDRFTPRIDQGERIFDFWIVGGTCDELRSNIERLALNRNEKPMAVSFYPTGDGTASKGLMEMSNAAFTMSACYKCGDGVIVRVHNSEDSEQETEITMPCFNLKQTVKAGAYEVKTFYAGPDGTFEERRLGDF